MGLKSLSLILFEEENWVFVRYAKDEEWWNTMYEYPSAWKSIETHKKVVLAWNRELELIFDDSEAEEDFASD